MSRRDLLRRVEQLENRLDPQPVRRSVLDVPRAVWESGSDAIRAWVAQETKDYPQPRGKFVLMPEWDEPVKNEVISEQ